MWEQRAVAVARIAAAVKGLDPSGIRPLRVGEHAVVHLPAAGLLAKIMADRRLLDPVRHELAVARWLFSAGIPVVRPAVDEPLVVDGFVVALWEYVPDAQAADLAVLARSLRQLHSLSIPDQPVLSPIQPFARLEDRLASASVDTTDRAFLAQLGNQLSVQWDHATYDLPSSVVHGDAHMDNLLSTGSGRLAFVDLEHVAVGPPEWDLTLTALYYECGWFTRGQYETFASEYGFDVRTSTAWPVLRSIRMLRMTTWLAQTAADYPERQAQLRHRIASLRDGTAPAGWTGF